MAPVVQSMKDLGDYQEADLVRKKIEACFSAFVTQPPGLDPLTLGESSTSADGAQRFESFEPGMVEYLRAGEEVTFGDPKPSEGVAEYTKVQLHGIAAGIGVTYDMLTGDLAEVNYSSIRAGMVQFRREAGQWQWNLFIPMFCERVWKAFDDACVLAGLVKTPDKSVEWSTPKWEYVNPLDDIRSEAESIEAGLMSYSEAIRKRGYDPEKVFNELAEDKKLLIKLGILVPEPVAAPAPEPTPEPRKDAATHKLLREAADALTGGHAEIALGIMEEVQNG